MRYYELFESIKILDILKGSRKKLSNKPNVYWHQTGIKAAALILEHGFKTGAELGKGESCDAIFFIKGFHGYGKYSRGENKTVYIPVDISNLNIITNNEYINIVKLDSQNQKMVDDGHWTEEYAKSYQIILDMDNGKIPLGYDGILLYSPDKKYIRRLALTKNAANIGLKHAIELLNSLSQN